MISINRLWFQVPSQIVRFQLHKTVLTSDVSRESWAPRLPVLLSNLAHKFWWLSWMAHRTQTLELYSQLNIKDTNETPHEEVPRARWQELLSLWSTLPSWHVGTSSSSKALFLPLFKTFCKAQSPNPLLFLELRGGVEIPPSNYLIFLDLSWTYLGIHSKSSH